jgi:hypothetical protein
MEASRTNRPSSQPPLIRAGGRTFNVLQEMHEGSPCLRGIYLAVAPLAFILTRQFLGWINGKSTLSNMNSDALLFAALIGSLTGLWFLYKKLDDSSLTSESFWKSGFWVFARIGAAFAVGLALAKPLFVVW